MEIVRSSFWVGEVEVKFEIMEGFVLCDVDIIRGFCLGKFKLGGFIFGRSFL